MNVGLVGGTFDPIHQGHLDVAQAARQALDLDEVWLVPARTPPHRHQPVASATHRFAMAALACEGQAAVRVSDVEMDRPGPSYTIDTLDALTALHGPRVSFYCILGADAFADVPTWRAYPTILDRCHFVAVSRPGKPVAALRAALPALASRMCDAPCTRPPTPSIFLVDALTAAVSSTGIRQALRADRSIAGLVPTAVAAYIEHHALYRAPLETRHG